MEGIADKHIVTSREAVQPVIDALVQADEIAFDYETTGLDFMQDSVHGISLATGGPDWYVCGPALPKINKVLVDLVRDTKKLWVAWNAKYDLHFMMRTIGVIPKNIADAMVASWLIDENQKQGLKHQAYLRLRHKEGEYLSRLKNLPFETRTLAELPEYGDLQKEAKALVGKRRYADVSIEDIPLEWLVAYGALDGRMTWDIWQVLKYLLDQEGLTDLFFNTKMEFMKVLFEMEQTGAWIDTNQLSKLQAEYEEKLEEATNRWEQLSGGVNPNSNPQLQKYLYEDLGYPVTLRTANGAPSCDVLALQRLLPRDEEGNVVQDQTHPVVALMDMRKYQKMLKTYIYKYQDALLDGRIHTGFNLTGTVTGRLSSSHPVHKINLQNVPSRGEFGSEIRSFFGAPPGQILGVFDYSQIELRWLAHFSQDPNLIDAFSQDKDIHQTTADLTSASRQVGKTLNFAIVYLVGWKTLSNNMEKNGLPRPSKQQAEAWLDALRYDAYAVATEWGQKTIAEARKNGYVRTITGRKRRLPNINHPDNYLRNQAERRAVNSRVQGSAADTIELAMIRLNPFVKWMGGKMVLQVHDELGYYLPDKEGVREMEQMTKEIMAGFGKELGCTVPLKAEGGLGDPKKGTNNWAALH